MGVAYLAVRDWRDVGRGPWFIAIHRLQVVVKIIIDCGKSCRNSIPYFK